MSDEHTRVKDELAGTKDELAQTKDDLAFYSRELARTNDELARTKVELEKANELSTARLTELVRAQSFLSTTDRISEAEVLGIVRDLNENIIQLAANLTEEWGKLKSPQPNSKTIPTKEELDALLQFHGPTLVLRVRSRDPPAVAFLVQSCVCYAVTQITLGWRRDHSDEWPWMLGSVYKRLSSYGKHTSHAAIEVALIYLPKSSSHCVSIANHIADFLSITGSFRPTEKPFDFVKLKASSRIETITKLAMRLERAFMVDITSSDMRLLLEVPSMFDDRRMSKEFDEDSTPGGQVMKVVGTTEVGVEKTVYERRGEGRPGEVRCTTVLLKARVVLEKDVAQDLLEVESETCSKK